MTAALEGALGLTFLHFLWQGALLGLAAALVLYTLRGGAARHRHAIVWIALLASLAWPAAELAGRSRVALSERSAILVHKSRTPFDRIDPGRITAGDVAGRHGSLLVAAWAAGMLLLMLRTGVGMAWIRRRARGPAAADWERRCATLSRRMGIRRTVAVRLSDRLDSPVTAGWRHPVILLPAALAANLPPAQMDALLAHELAHIRRHDYPANLVQVMVTTLLFFHPAVWWLSRRLDAERELLADALAAQALGDARTLAQALAELDRQRHAGFALVQAATGGELLTRVRALVTPQAGRLRLRAVIPAVLAAVGGVALAAHAAGEATGGTLTRVAVIDFAKCKKPVWPAAALAAQHTGTVTMRFQVGLDGAVVRGDVLRSSGHDSLDQAALRGLLQCRFQPAQLEGVPLATSQTMMYVWTLE